jgi:uncharacterized protein (DUF1330 family)
MSIMNRVKLAILLIATVGVSIAGTAHYLQSVSQHAVYVIGAVTVTDPERLPEYQAVAQPMAHRLSGYTPLAFDQPLVLEGELPLDARYFVERFSSMTELEAFLAEMEKSGALALRDAAADVHFMLALPAYP